MVAIRSRLLGLALAGRLNNAIAMRCLLRYSINICTQIMELIRQVVLLGPATLPAVTPVQDQELEAKCINLDGWLETNAQIVVIHLVELGAGMEQTDVTRNGEEQVIVEGRQFR